MMIELKQGFIMGTSIVGGDRAKAKNTRGGSWIELMKLGTYLELNTDEGQTILPCTW